MSPAELVRKYQNKGVLIDTNLLVGYVIGVLDPRHLHNCRATKSFSPDDFALLNRFLRQFRSIVITPHILTEVSNLAGKLPEDLHVEFRLIFREIISRLSEASESSKAISAKKDFLRFGLTDTGISIVAPGRYLVLTDEFALAGLSNKRGVPVLNFNHLRAIAWQQVS